MTEQQQALLDQAPAGLIEAVTAMVLKQLEQLQQPKLNVVPISVYCEQYNSTVPAINKRLERGHWNEGVEVLKVPNSKERWIDLAAVEAWVRKAA